MNKILTLALLSALTLVLSTGCSSKGGVINTEASKDAIHIKMHNNEKIVDAIIKAGKKANWKITKFKSNEVIAEKIGNNETISSSIKIYNGYMEFSNNSQTSDLRDAIEDELKNQGKTH